eukprot:255270-Amorphochlora_amoeboformis.AAC.1
MMNDKREILRKFIRKFLGMFEVSRSVAWRDVMSCHGILGSLVPPCTIRYNRQAISKISPGSLPQLSRTR